MATTNLSEPGTAAPGDFLGWWLAEIGAAFPRRAPRRARAPRNALLLRRDGDAIEVFRLRNRAIARVGELELPPPLPATLGDAGAAPPPPILLSPESRRIVELLRRRPRGVPLVLVVEADEGLLCTDFLPAGAEAELDRIMPHRVDLLTPWTPDRVHAGYRLTGKRDAGRVEVLLAAVPRAVVDPTLSRLAAYGVAVEAVDLLRDDGDPAGVNVLPAAKGGKARGVRWWRVACAVLVLAAAGGGALAGYEAYRVRDRLEDRQRHAAALEQRLADLPELAARVDALRRNAEFVPAQQRQTPSPIVVLEVLSRILPDSIWLDQVGIEAGEVTLSGYAEDAAQVLPIVESSGHFGDARFTAPSTRVAVPVPGGGGGTREVERFSLGAKVAPQAEPEP